MKKIESLARTSGLDYWGNLDFPTNFFPVDERYITISNFSNCDSKNYGFFHEVCQLVAPILMQYGVKIYQVDKEGRIQTEFIHSLVGETTFRQACYVLKNSILHIGIDNVLTHLATSYETNTIALYGSTDPDNFAPESPYLIKSFKGYSSKKPSYDEFEEIKQINNIKPEDVAQEILENLGVNINIGMETVFRGLNYLGEMSEVVPDFQINEPVFGESPIILRTDLDLQNENDMVCFLKFHACIIVTKKSFSDVFLQRCRPNILKVVYDISEGYDINFLNKIVSLGIPYSLECDGDCPKINDYRVELFEFLPVVKKNKHSIEESGYGSFDKVTEGTFIKSNKYLISKGKKYFGEYFYKKGLHLSEKSGKVVPKQLDQDFIQDLNKYYLYNKV